MMFAFDFNLEKFSKVIPNNPNIQEWFYSLSHLLPTYEITSISNVSAFLAQTVIESGCYSHLQENLNYSSQGLLNTFKTHFTAEESVAYAYQPQKIANRVYANRYGNGDESSGDGWKYSGKGLIQVTFKANYQQYSEWAYKNDSVVDNPQLLIQPKDAVLSALWFWTKHKLSVLAETQNMIQITKIINGGLNDLQDRIQEFNKIKEILG